MRPRWLGEKLKGLSCACLLCKAPVRVTGTGNFVEAQGVEYCRLSRVGSAIRSGRSAALRFVACPHNGSAEYQGDATAACRESRVLSCCLAGAWWSAWTQWQRSSGSSRRACCAAGSRSASTGPPHSAPVRPCWSAGLVLLQMSPCSMEAAWHAREHLEESLRFVEVLWVPGVNVTSPSPWKRTAQSTPINSVCLGRMAMLVQVPPQ